MYNLHTVNYTQISVQFNTHLIPTQSKMKNAFITTKGSLCPFPVNSFPHLSPVTTFFTSITKNSYAPFFNFIEMPSYNIHSCVWFLLTSISFEIQPYYCRYQYFILFFNYRIIHYVIMPQIVYSFFCWWTYGNVSSLGQLRIKLLWTFLYKSFCGHTYSFLLHIYLKKVPSQFP